MLKVILFYKYAKIENTLKFRENHLNFCKNLGVRGRILVAGEGINGSVSGTKEQIEEYKKELSKNHIFRNIEFKEDDCLMHPFNRMVIKIKPELVRFEQNVDLKNTGKHLSAEEFLRMAKEENSIILDARNDYESKVGKFKNAITPQIKTFREFPQVLEQIEEHKDKKILMYCTGGIRCEKASAYLKENGFNDVYQLHGGILTFGKHLPDTIWEGKCFVFDKRIISEINDQKNLPISNCELCNIPCDLYKNCKNNECDEFFSTCLKCEKDFGGCCSKECFKEILKG